MKYWIYIVICLCCISCLRIKESYADKNLKSGFLFVDEAGIVHWDKDCKRTAGKILELKPLSEYKKYCSCVAPDKIDLINALLEKQNEITKCMICVKGKDKLVSLKNLEKYGIDSYIKGYPGSTIRMRDNENNDYDIPIEKYHLALGSSLRLFIVAYIPLSEKDNLSYVFRDSTCYEKQ